MSKETARIPVMFDRVLRPEWLDYSLDQYTVSVNKVDLDGRLRTYLSEEIKTPTSMRKTVSQLQRTVGFLSSTPREELLTAHKKMCDLAPSQRTKMRMELLVRANPFVADCFDALAKLYLVGKREVAATDLYDRLTLKYGDRGTIPRRVRYVFTTLQYFGALENRRGKWLLVEGAGVW